MDSSCDTASTSHPPFLWPERQLDHLLKRAHQRAARLVADQFVGLQLTPAQFAVLAKLYERGEISHNHLGRLTATDPATIQGIVRRLLDRGLIRLRDDPVDRRRILLSLTEDGQRLAALALPKARMGGEMVAASLDAAEQKELVRLLRKLLTP